MNPLLIRLARLRRRLRLGIGWRGICAVVSLIVGGAVLLGMADWFFELPGLIRSWALVTMVLSASLLFHRVLVVPLASRCDNLSLALRIEEEYPDLNDALASTVQFLQAPHAGNASASLRHVAIQRTLALTDKCDFGKILNRRGLWWITVCAMAAVLAAGHFLYHYAEFSHTALWRLLEPFGNHTWTRITLDDAPHRVAQGQPFVVKGQIAGIIPASAHIEIDGALKSDKVVPIKTNPTTPNLGVMATGIDMTRQKGRFRFRIHANDGVYPARHGEWHEVEVMPPPKFAMLDGALSPQLEFRYPEYTDLPSPDRRTPGTKQIAGVVGTHVTYRAAFDRPLQSAWVEFRPENASLRGIAALAHLGQRHALNAAAALSASHAVWGRVYGRFEDDEKHILHLSFLPWILGTYSYVLHVRDELGLAVEFVADMSVHADPLPAINLQKPTTSISVLPDAEIAFKMSVSDDEFAVRSVYLEFRKKDVEHRWLDQGPSRRYLYEHGEMGKAVPRLLAALSNIPIAGPDMRLRLKTLDIATKWELKNQFQEGETVVLQVAADDFCDLFPDRPAGRSHEIELHIIGKAELARLLDDGLGKAQQDLVRLQQLQAEALNLVKDIQQKREKNKQTPRDLDQLIEAEQLQKQIQERLGNTAAEGLRNELAKMQQMIKDNKLPSSEITDQVKTLRNELERLSQDDLQQIEPNLAEARKELAGTAKAEGKQKSPLDKARKLQEQAKQTLDELAQFLDPWAGMHQVRGETRDLLNKQKELQQAVAKNQDAQAEFDNAGKQTEKTSKVKQELSDDREQKAQAQLDLSGAAQKLLKMMEAAKEKRDPDDKDKLAKASAIGAKAQLPTKMTEISNDIKQNHPNDAVRKQDENIKALERMLAALEDRKEDDLDRLKKKQKTAGDIKDSVDKLAQEQERLQKKVKEANKITNPEERSRELKKLAQEQEKLKEEAQKNARELARLQEERAAQALDRAAQEMKRAVERLEDGRDPEEMQEEALDRLEEAHAKLEQFEEELAREQLTKIADRIKGLKVRQDAAVARSKELYKKVMAKKKWSTGLIESSDADKISQEGLSKETRALKEKVKEAKVFEHVFEKAALAMDKAEEAMKDRTKMAKERRFAEFDKEELGDENQRAGAIEKHQTSASSRLQRLLDALKMDRPEVAQNEEPKREDGAGGDEGGAKGRPGDGIPPMAQLKVLKAEQLEINERTQEMAKHKPTELNDAQRDELRDLQVEQGRLHRLFEEMTTAGESKGAMP